GPPCAIIGWSVRFILRAHHSSAVHFSFFFYLPSPPPHPPSFPTRRSSDLDDISATHGNVIAYNRVTNNKPDCGITVPAHNPTAIDRKSTRLNSSHGSISYAVFCLKKKKTSHEKIQCRRTTQRQDSEGRPSR